MRMGGLFFGEVRRRGRIVGVMIGYGVVHEIMPEVNGDTRDTRGERVELRRGVMDVGGVFGGEMSMMKGFTPHRRALNQGSVGRKEI